MTRGASGAAARTGGCRRFELFDSPEDADRFARVPGAQLVVVRLAQLPGLVVEFELLQRRIGSFALNVEILELRAFGRGVREMTARLGKDGVEKVPEQGER